MNVNLALNKPTIQSSVYARKKLGYRPHGACNGKKTGKFGFHTLKENKPWWQIDLQMVCQINRIEIYNRLNFEKRASTLDIFLSKDGMKWNKCYSNDEDNLFGGIDGKPLIVNIQNQIARFVRLQLRESNQFFHLDEVEIYGIPLITLDGLCLNNYELSSQIREKFAKQNNINVSLIDGEEFDHIGEEFDDFKPVKRKDPYKLLNFVPVDQLNQYSLIEDVTALHIKKGERFGNSIKQISNAYHIAKEIGVKKIYLSDFWYVVKGQSITKSNIKIINGHSKDFSQDKIVLQGNFFYNETLAPLIKSPSNLYSIMAELSDIFNINLLSQSLGENDLVIHLRSGDIFVQKPHRRYGQPPLAFYKKIIELQSWNSISIVFENKLNVVIEPLIDFSMSVCNDVRQISSDIKSDIEYLLRAKVLIASRGTFCKAIVALSKNISEVYYFENFFNTGGNPHVNCIKVFDEQGLYLSEVLSCNWQNTDFQRNLMLNYPTSALKFF